MDKLIFASIEEGAGKTSIITGLADVMNKTVAYMKPFGDRLLYRKKRLWDYDFSVLKDVLNLTEDPDQATLGFDHSKMRFMYDEKSVIEKLNEQINKIENKEVLFIEGGKRLNYGMSVHLDALSLAAGIDYKKLIIIVSGDEGGILDDCQFIKEYPGR